MILHDVELERLCREEALIVGWEPELINPASIDVRLGDRVMVENPKHAQLEITGIDQRSKADPFWLQPGGFVLAETIEIFNALVAGRPLHHHGEVFHLDRGFTLRFKPVREHIPVWIASLNPRSLDLTAKLADGWMPIMIPQGQLEAEIAAFRSRVVAAGRPADAVAVRSPDRVVVALEDPRRARRQAAGSLAFYIARMGTFYGAQLERFGHGEAVAAVRRAWNENGAEAGIDAVPDELLDQITTVGSVAECAARIDAEHRSGVDMHNVTVQSRSEADLERALGDLVGA